MLTIPFDGEAEDVASLNVAYGASAVLSQE